eukprot:CAMPEP_0198724426 /NCGR_PEP_ID=MMETSP1475-20131203/1906_1 /TAXON_ID= ORGANISM="Unidentified sp., Strain CCMP1999" /NCGR_SAMPLE_ID=MMETSP1475 /ASSEMBLY_ACC=CAM_ASM_001111 /LENGTH=220 /DNA_ID=CAMNT_0044485957 /DNA_START=123 /DNA_END=782 /DNA_ORIENTATION=+
MKTVLAALVVLAAAVSATDVVLGDNSDGDTMATCRGTRKVKFEVVLPSGQKYVELFVRRNGEQIVAQAVHGSEKKIGKGLSVYSKVVGGFRGGDDIEYRFYSYLPGGERRFTPGKQEMVWLRHSCKGGKVNVRRLSRGRALFTVMLPSGQKYVEVFSRQNGEQNVATEVTASERRVGGGRSIYKLVRGGYKCGDQIEARAYSYLPISAGVFTPGPEEQRW